STIAAHALGTGTGTGATRGAYSGSAPSCLNASAFAGGTGAARESLESTLHFDSRPRTRLRTRQGFHDAALQPLREAGSRRKAGVEASHGGTGNQARLRPQASG